MSPRRELDEIAEKRIGEAGAMPAFKGYHGYPATICASINDEVIHGIPSGRRVLEEGDIISIDVGASLGGYFGDSAVTLPVGRVSEEAATLLRVTEESLYKAIEHVRPGGRVSDIGHAVQQHVEALRVFGGARVRRARHRAADARGAAGAQLRRAGPRAAAGRGHGAGDRADGERRQAGGEGAGGRLDGGDARQEPVGALRAHGGGDGGRAVDSDGASRRRRRRWPARSSVAGRRRRHEQLPSALYRVRLDDGHAGHGAHRGSGWTGISSACWSAIGCALSSRRSTGAGADSRGRFVSDAGLCDAEWQGSDEGPSVGEADLRQVQDRPPPRRGAGDLPEPEAQAAAGITVIAD